MGAAEDRTPRSMSVVICAYTEDRWAALSACIRSVHRQTLQPTEVILVIDHNAALYSRARATLGGVRVIENAALRGLSGARNSGIAASSGEIIAFIDDDATASDDWLQRLCERFADSRVLAVGGTILPVWPHGRPFWFPEELDWVVGCTYRGMPERLQRVRNVIGANMSFRREVLEATGGFQSSLGRVGLSLMGAEETELCIRAVATTPHGLVLFEPLAIVWHHLPASRTVWRYFRTRCYAEGLSKALLATMTHDGLVTERTYVTRTLPLGMARGFWDFLRGDLGGAARAVAILAGLTITTAGYIAGGTLPGRRSSEMVST